MSVPGRWDFVLLQGASFHYPITWLRGHTKESVSPVDLTGYIARMQIRDKVQASEAIITLSTGTGHIALGGEEGTIDITITDEETAALDFDGPAFYDLELESAGGEVTRFLQGRVGFSREVTRNEAI